MSMRAVCRRAASIASHPLYCKSNMPSDPPERRSAGSPPADAAYAALPSACCMIFAGVRLVAAFPSGPMTLARRRDSSPELPRCRNLCRQSASIRARGLLGGQVHPSRIYRSDSLDLHTATGRVCACMRFSISYEDCRPLHHMTPPRVARELLRDATSVCLSTATEQTIYDASTRRQSTGHTMRLHTPVSFWTHGRRAVLQ
jgi:hypothetical protein